MLYRNNYCSAQTAKFIYGFEHANTDTANEIKDTVADNIREVVERTGQDLYSLKDDIIKSIDTSLQVDIVDSNGVFKVRNDSGSEFQYVPDMGTVTFNGEIREEQGGHLFLKVSGKGTNGKPFSGWVSSEYVKGDSLDAIKRPVAQKAPEESAEELARKEAEKAEKEAAEKAQAEAAEAAEKADNLKIGIDILGTMKGLVFVPVDATSEVIKSKIQLFKDQFKQLKKWGGDNPDLEREQGLIGQAKVLEKGLENALSDALKAEEKKRQEEAEKDRLKQLGKLDTYLGSFLDGVDLSTLSLASKQALSAWSKIKTKENKPYLDVGSGNSLWLNVNFPQEGWSGENKTFKRIDAKWFTDANIKDHSKVLQLHFEQEEAEAQDALVYGEKYKEDLDGFRLVDADNEESLLAKLKEAKKFKNTIPAKEQLGSGINDVIAQLEMGAYVYEFRDTRYEGLKEKDMEDNSYIKNNLESIASANLLKYMLEDFKDTDFGWDYQREEAMAKKTVGLVGDRLKEVKGILDGAPIKSGEQYEWLQKMYRQDAKLFAEITLNVGDRYEMDEFRDIEQGTLFAGEAVAHMDYDEAFSWTEDLMDRIDENDWQSSGTKAAYQNLAAVCRNHLVQKLTAERSQIEEGDAEAVDANIKKSIECANLFTDRGYDIDGDLTNPDWAAQVLKDAVDFNALAMSYAEKQMQTENPLKSQIEERKGSVLKYLENPQIQTNPESAQFAKDAQVLLGKETYDMGELGQQWAYINMIESMRDGTRFDPENCQDEVGDILGDFIEDSQKGLVKFLDRSRGTDKAMLGKLGELTSITGKEFSGSEKKAFLLLAEIEGFGTWDISDSTWNTAAEVAKVVAIVAAGIAVGIATGGAGFAAMAAAIGVSGVVGTTALAATAVGLTTAGASGLVYQKGFDNMGDFAKVYGKEFTMGAAGGSIGRLANSARIAYLANQSGTMASQSAFKIMMEGGPRMQTLAGALEDSAVVGSRLRYLSMGGELAFDGATGIMADATINTAFDGGSFLGNMKNAFSNPTAYIGVGIGAGLQLSPSVLKAFGKADTETLNALDGSMKSIKQARSRLDDLGMLQRVEADIKSGAIGDVDDYMRLNADAFPQGAGDHVRNLLLSQNDVRLYLDDIGIDVQTGRLRVPSVSDTVDFIKRNTVKATDQLKKVQAILKNPNLFSRDTLVDAYITAAGTVAILQKKIATLPVGQMRDSLTEKVSSLRVGLKGMKEKISIRERLDISNRLSSARDGLKKVIDSASLSKVSVPDLKKGIHSVVDTLGLLLKNKTLSGQDRQGVKKIQGILKNIIPTINKGNIADIRVRLSSAMDLLTKFKPKRLSKGSESSVETVSFNHKKGDVFVGKEQTLVLVSVKGNEVEYRVTNNKIGEGKGVSIVADKSDFVRLVRDGEFRQKPKPRMEDLSTFKTAEEISWKLTNLRPGDMLVTDGSGTKRLVVGVNKDGSVDLLVFPKGGVSGSYKESFSAGVIKKKAQMVANGRNRYSSISQVDRNIHSRMKFEHKMSQKDVFKTKQEINWKMNNLESGDYIQTKNGVEIVVVGSKNGKVDVVWKKGNDWVPFSYESMQDLQVFATRGGRPSSVESGYENFARNAFNNRNRQNQRQNGQRNQGQQRENNQNRGTETVMSKYAENMSVLGLDSSSSFADAQKAWRKQMKDLHPDNFKEGSVEYVDATEKSKIINGAFDYLKRENKKVKAAEKKEA